MANINTFISKFKKDLARPCNFEVEFQAPLNSARGTNPYANNFLTMARTQLPDLKFKCEQAELPPRAMTLIQQKTYGPLEFFPIQNVYNKSVFTFIMSDNMVEKALFDYWMDVICPTAPDFIATGTRFDFDYKVNYVLDVKIRQKDLTGKTSYAIRLSEAFPTEVYSLPLSWSQQNDYHRLNVVFTYRYWNILYDETPVI